MMRTRTAKNDVGDLLFLQAVLPHNRARRTIDTGWIMMETKYTVNVFINPLDGE